MHWISIHNIDIEVTVFSESKSDRFQRWVYLANSSHDCIFQSWLCPCWHACWEWNNAGLEPTSSWVCLSVSFEDRSNICSNCFRVQVPVTALDSVQCSAAVPCGKNISTTRSRLQHVPITIVNSLHKTDFRIFMKCCY